MRRTFVLMAVLVSAFALLASGTAFAEMEDYCIVPPYVIQNVPPNVMLLLDNSDSMFKFAYTQESCPNQLANKFYLGLSLADLNYNGRETDSLYFYDWDTAPVHEFSVGEFVYLQVNGSGRQCVGWDWSSGPCDAGWETLKYWRGVHDDDRLKISSIGPFDGGIKVTLVDEGGNSLVDRADYVPGTNLPKIREYNKVLMFKADCAVVDDAIDPGGNNLYKDWTVKDSSFDPAETYYGYFSPIHWYIYGSQKFIPTVPKPLTELTDARAKLDNEWDGNFLNWLAMRRVDVMRKALTGGKTVGGTRVAEPVDTIHNGVYKWVANAEDYVSSTYLQNTVTYEVEAGPRCFYFPPGTGTAKFQVDTVVDGNCSTDKIDEDNPFDSNTSLGSSVYGADIKLSGIEALPDEEIEGVLQKVVGARARIGLTWFDSNDDGGDVVTDMDGQALSSVINDINLTPPGSKTPLAEALWTVTGYFAHKKGFNPTGHDFDDTTRATGPFYTSSYGVTTNEDPMNFGSGGSPRRPKCAKNFVLLVTDGNPCHDGDLPDYILNFAKTGTVTKSRFNCGSPNNVLECPPVSGAGYDFPHEWIFNRNSYPVKDWLECLWSDGGTVAGLEDVALYSHITDLRDTDIGTVEMDGEEEEKQNITLYIVNAFGEGSTLLKYAAINGGFEDKNDNDKPDLVDEWDADGNGEPDNFYAATGGAELEQAIEDAFSSMLKRASSGTAASVLASGEDSGANLIQAIFYPRRRFGNEVIRWTGSLQSFWYYVDPYFVNNSIREDTVHDYKLHMEEDNIVKLEFDDDAQAAIAQLFSSDEYGSATGHIADVPIEEVDFIWEAGMKLFERDISTDPRTIYTPDFINGIILNPGYINGTLMRTPAMTEPYMIAFSSAASTINLFWPLMDPYGVDNTETDRVIRYMHGEDFSEDPVYKNIYRDRAVTISGTSGVWKLADILNSTPQIAAREVIYKPDENNIIEPWLRRMPVSTDYSLDYDDKTFEAFLNSPAQDVIGEAEIGMVFAGANDGMLHAFRLGNVGHDWKADDMDPQQPLEKGRLTGSDLGEEAWAFIPLNALPYLKYFPLRDYCHVYTVDLSPFLFDAAIMRDATLGDDDKADEDLMEKSGGGQASWDGCNATEYHNCIKSRDSWATVLIGGMRFGGACKDGPPGVQVANPERGIGYSSYFALDVTDPENPKFLWEFAHPQLGFATTGPVVVKINGKYDDDGDSTADTTSHYTNGRWYVIFGSGPTGPIETLDHQFMGNSDQDLRYFVLDAKTGKLLQVIEAGDGVGGLGITEAFSSTLHATSADTDSDYSDDVVYLGYSMKDTGTNPNFTWTKGGVLRLITREEILDETNNPWELSEVINDIGPVTAAPQMLGNNEAFSGEDQVWLFFGSGRYFYDTGSMHDDFESTRYLYGMPDNCYTGELFEKPNKGETPDKTFMLTCPAPISEPEGTGPTTLGNADDSGVEDADGWRIALSPYLANPDSDLDPDLDFAAERLITDPVASPATNVVFFTTFRPYEMMCGLGGMSTVWAVDARTAGSVADRLKGKALVQVSTGVIEEIDLASAFSERENRRSVMIEGVPPMAQGMSMFTQPAPISRIFHIIER